LRKHSKAYKYVTPTMVNIHDSLSTSLFGIVESTAPEKNTLIYQ